MAVVQNPLIGAARGSVGNSTFSRVKGQNILKAKAVPSGLPPTDNQLAQQNAFRFGMYIGTRQLAPLKKGFPTFRGANRKHQSEINAFMDRNVGQDKAIENNPLSLPALFTFTASKLQFSDGPLLPPEGAFVSDPNSGSFTVTYQDNTNAQDPNAQADDFILVVMVEGAGNLINPTNYFIIQNSVRSTGSVTKSLPIGFVGKTFEIYVFFWRETDNLGGNDQLSQKASETIALGPTTIV